MSQNIEYLSTKDFLEEPGKGSVFHGFFTRKGGHSKGLYEGLNCGLGSGDDRDDISQNRSLVAKNAGVSADKLLSTYQVHGASVVIVEAPWSEEERPHADAIVCDKPGLALSILTADCTPVLFAGLKEDNSPVIGAAHAGWQGALSGVMENTLETMKSLGVQEQSLRACVGPCIAQASYEVSNDFISPFIEEEKDSEQFFIAGQKEGHANFDLSGYCSWRLVRYGLNSVSLLGLDTYTQEDYFYSYRRTTHRNEKDYGRQISVISIL